MFLRAHKEVLWFASPFFQAALSGNWAETGRPLSMSSVITISQPPIVPGDKIHPDAPIAMTFAPVDPDLDPDELDIEVSESASDSEVLESSTSTIGRPGEDDRRPHGPAGESGAHDEADAEAQKKAHEAARMESLEKLQRGASAGSSRGPDKVKGKGIVKLSWKRGHAQVSARHHQAACNPDAVIVLKEEKVRLSRSASYYGIQKDPPHLIGRTHPRQAPFMTFSDSSTPGTRLPSSGKRRTLP